MLIVTAAAGDERDACLVGFSTQTSIHPSRFLACLSRKNRTYRIACAAEHLAVHVVPADAEAPELAQDGQRVEVHALADEAIVLEDEQCDAAALEGPLGRRDPVERAAVRAEQLELGDDGAVGVVQRDQAVALVGEGRAALG